MYGSFYGAGEEAFYGGGYHPSQWGMRPPADLGGGRRYSRRYNRYYPVAPGAPHQGGIILGPSWGPATHGRPANEFYPRNYYAYYGSALLNSGQRGATWGQPAPRSDPRAVVHKRRSTHGRSPKRPTRPKSSEGRARQFSDRFGATPSRVPPHEGTKRVPPPNRDAEYLEPKRGLFETNFLLSNSPYHGTTHGTFESEQPEISMPTAPAPVSPAATAGASAKYHVIQKFLPDATIGIHRQIMETDDHAFADNECNCHHCGDGGDNAQHYYNLTAGQDLLLFDNNNNTSDLIRQALFLCAPFLSKKENVHLFLSSLPRFDKCHETSRIFTRTEQTFASARSFGVIS